MRLLIAFGAILWSAVALAANIRPSTETSYTIQTSDVSGYVIGTNQNAGMAWTLDTLATYGANPSFTLKNNSRYEIVVRPTGNAIGAFAGVKTYSLALQSGQSAIVWSDGTDWQYTASPAAMTSSIGTATYILSSSAITEEHFVTISGPCQTGDVVGFDWSSTTPSFSLQFRHTMNCATTSPWMDAGDDLSTQFKNNATVQSALTPDIALQASYLYDAASVGVYFNGNYTLQTTSTITLTAYKSAGATESVVAAPAGNTLGNPTGTVVGRSPSTFGKAPSAGDGLYCFLVIGDTSQGPAPVLTNLPDYGRQCWAINNADATNIASDFAMATGGARRGTMTFRTGKFFVNANQIVVGASSTNQGAQIVAHLGADQNIGMSGGTSIGPGGLIYAVNDADTVLEPLELVSSILKIRYPASGSGGQPLCIDASNQVYKGSGGHC